MENHKNRLIFFNATDIDAPFEISSLLEMLERQEEDEQEETEANKQEENESERSKEQD